MQILKANCNRSDSKISIDQRLSLRIERGLGADYLRQETSERQANLGKANILRQRHGS